MAFTEGEEKILKNVITAFNNGKRLSDLPDASGTNPFNMTCEVLDEDGESKKAALATLLPYAEEQVAYGIEWDSTINTYTCTRVGNMALHKSLPIQNRMRGCILDDNGNVVEYLDPRDWTKQVRDGSRGQVMVEMPLHYRRFITEGTKFRVMLSEYPVPGYHVVPKMYVSAYEATIQRSTGKLSSVCSMDVDYRGCGNQAAWDGTYRTALGKPASGMSLDSARAAARKRGSEKWNTYCNEVHKAIIWLYCVEYASRNTQDAYTAELTPEGYKKGGLDAGVTNIGHGEWNTHNDLNPFIPCGHTDSLGNGTGVVKYTLLKEDGGTLKEFDVPRYRGIENWFGHVWKWCDGALIVISANEEAGGDGLSKVYTCVDPAKFSSSAVNNYRYVGNEARVNGFVKEIIFGEYGEFIPSVVGGGDRQHFCDNHYTNVPNSGSSTRGVLLGGNASYGSTAGAFFVSSHLVPSASSAALGARLCFIPTN